MCLEQLYVKWLLDKIYWKHVSGNEAYWNDSCWFVGIAFTLKSFVRNQIFLCHLTYKVRYMSSMNLHDSAINNINSNNLEFRIIKKKWVRVTIKFSIPNLCAEEHLNWSEENSHKFNNFGHFVIE